MKVRPSFKVDLGSRTVTVEALSVETSWNVTVIELTNEEFNKLLFIETIHGRCLDNYAGANDRESVYGITLNSGDKSYKFTTKVQVPPGIECHRCHKFFYQDEDLVSIHGTEDENYIKGKTVLYGTYCRECYESFLPDVTETIVVDN